MRPIDLDQLVLLPRDSAVERGLDAANARVLRVLVYVAGPVVTIGTLVALGEAEGRGHWLAALAGLVAVFLLRRTRFYVAGFRQILLAFLLYELGVVLLAAEDPGASYGLAGFLFPLVLLLFRIKPAEHAALLAVATAAAAWELAAGGDVPLAGRLWMMVGVVLWQGGTWLAGRHLRRRRVEELVRLWQRERDRAAEESRMKDELHDARQVQLSMLPRRPPALPWVDVAASSIPASEVGGDYYDFAVLSQRRLAVVVGDVAGHGMTSGLMLAAVRAGIHLLRDELGEPAAAMRRLDALVCELAPRRMHVTLQIAILDRDAGRVEVVSAGHPPARLLRPGGGAVEEIGAGAPPLGTLLAGEFAVESAPLAPGDLLLMVTDGALELRDEAGRALGDDGLARGLERAAAGATAAAVRDRLLERIHLFRGAAGLADDLTVVVARVGEPETGERREQ